MRCCERCGCTDRWTYELGGDGDGVEFLVEEAHLDSGRTTRTSVMFSVHG